MLPQADVWSRLTAMTGVHARQRVNRHVEIAMAAEGIGFAGETSVMDSDPLLTSGIQFPCQQSCLQFLDGGRENSFKLVDSHLLPFTNQ